ncbi:MAG: rod shape-determining protein MreD [Kiritimatiellia bacterium]|jgi:rod shape-determining protein MreD|nr:rod shape-determining protein MreD [Kiritimatiellia bacterium]
MTWIVMSVVVMLSTVIQTMLPAYAFMGQARAPMLLAIVLYYSLKRDTTTMLTAALMAGFVHDALSEIPMGYSSLCFGAVGFAAGHFRELITKESLLPHSLIGAAAGFASTVVLYAILKGGGHVGCRLNWCILKAFWTGVLGLWSVPLVCALTAWLDGLVGNIAVRRNVTGIE